MRKSEFSNDRTNWERMKRIKIPLRERGTAGRVTAERASIRFVRDNKREVDLEMDGSESEKERFEL